MARGKGRASQRGISEIQAETLAGNADEAGTGSIFDAMGDDSYVNIRRRDPKSQMWAYCGRLTPAEAREEVLKERGGGGTFQCKEMVRNPDTGAFQYGRQRTITVEGPSWAWRDPAPSVQGVQAAMPTPEVATAEGKMTPNDVLTAAMLDVLRAGRDGAEAQTRATTALIESVTKKGGTPEWLPAVIGALAPLLERLLNPPATANPTEMMLAGMKMARELSNPATSLKEQFAAMEAMLDLKMKARDLEEGTGGMASTGDPLLDMVQTNLPRVLEVIGQLKQPTGAPSPAPVPRSLPPGVGVIAPPVPTSAPGGASPVWLLHLNNLRKPLLSFAKVGKDPMLVAEHVLEFMLPENVKGDLRAFLAQGDVALNQFLSFAPEFQPYAQWTAEVMTGMVEILHPADEDWPPEGGGGPRLVEEEPPGPATEGEGEAEP